MYWIRHQDGSRALHYAANSGHTEVSRLLLDRGADVNASNKVSDMIRDIVMIICVIDCVIMSVDSNVIVKSTCQHLY